MSRLERLKERKRKNRIKATACGLALSLAIGSVQGLGTYALFTDTEDFSSNLSISTGDVDVKISEGKTITDVNEGIVFSITNDGTLKQNISINIEPDENLRNYLGTTPKIYFFSGTEINNEITTSEPITLNKDINLVNKDDKTPFVLEPKPEPIQGYIELDIDDSIQKGREYKLYLNVKASQTGELGTNGFYDQDEQENIVNISNKPSIILEDTDGALSWVQGSSTGWIKGKIDINYNVNGTPKGLFEAIEELNGEGLDVTKDNIESVNGSGIFSDANCKLGDSKIEIPDISTNSLKYSYGQGDYIDIKFKDKNGTTEFYRVEFRKDIKFVQILFIPVPVTSIEAKVTKISEQEFNSGKTLNVNTLQGIEELDESNIIESSKENTQVIEEDVVESSKPEVIEPPKVEEEVVEPSKPEAIEPPKVEEEVVEPSKPDVIEPPNNEEVVAQKKDEDLE